MKNFIILLSILSFPLAGFSQQTKLEKAKQLIRNEFKETMNDYASYSPVSYGKVDSLFTSPFDNESTMNILTRAFEAKEKAGLGDIEGLPDVSETIQKMEAEEHLYKEGAVLSWKIYQNYRDLFYMDLKYFMPEFIGWKLLHKYRTKNSYNATILKEQEFNFNKQMTSITAIKDVDD